MDQDGSRRESVRKPSRTDEESPKLAPAPALLARGLGRVFPKSARPALDSLDFEIRSGRITGLVGPDGAGKTTLLRLAATLLRPTAGELLVFGLDTRRDIEAIKARIGYMPQQFGLYEDLSVRENLDLFADLHGLSRKAREERFEDLLQMTDLARFTRRRAGKLSGGMKQKLGLACSLLVDPELLLLDEPTVGVDPVSRRDLWAILTRLVADQGMGVVVATSYLDEADRCDELLVLDEGRCRGFGTPESFREKVRGRVCLASPEPEASPRVLQSELARLPEVSDCAIRSGRLRCLAGPNAGEARARIEKTMGVARVEETEPTFEDAFMDMQAARSAQPTEPTIDDSGHEPHDDEVVVEVRELGKRFGDFQAVSGIGFAVRRGEIFGLLGPNGAGKTTTFRMLCGLLAASEGEIRVAGRDLRRAGGHARARLGYMAQGFSLYLNLTVRQNLRFFGQVYGLGGRRLRERIATVLRDFDLEARRDDEAASLPGGFKRRLAMAAAVLHEPEILFLDEPTSGADPLARREFWFRINAFADAGMTIIVTTHFMEEVESCDQVLVMSRGLELARGTPDEIRALARSDGNPDPTIEDAFIALSEEAAMAATNGGRSS